jgi:hypothetical protein
MRQLKRILLILLPVVVSASASGGVAVMQARSEYYGICSKLSGFPGFLQAAGLLQAGTCRSLPGGSLCGVGSACTVNGQAGKCANKGLPGGSPVCVCVANPTPGP